MHHLIRFFVYLGCCLILGAMQVPRDLRLELETIAPRVEGRPTRWALVVGISEYLNVPPHQQLRYAHRDAEEFAGFLKSRDGGSFPERQVRVLTEGKATLAAIRGSLNEWLPDSVGPRDVVYLFFAGHGVVAERDEGYFVAHDSDPQNLHATGLPFAEVNEALTRKIKAGVVVLLADACHSGSIGWTSVTGNPSQAQSAMEQLGGKDRTILKLLASRASERSFEDARWNGGHGAFTFALMGGLRGGADRDNDGVVRVGELIEHVSDVVPRQTGDRQHPRVAGDFEPRMALAIRRGVDATPEPQASGSLARLEGLIRDGKILESGGAWEYFRSEVFSAQEKGAARAMMATSLEGLGQLCVNDYVQSTVVGLKRGMLLRAVDAFEALKVFRPRDRSVEARRTFCLGRAQIAANEFAEAEQSLRTSIGLEADFACAYNALGVALGRQGRIPEARAAFDKAAQLTPEWSLPYLQVGQALMTAERAKDAVPYLERASRFNPRSLISHWTLLRAYRLTGERDGVERMGKVLIGANPNYAPTYLELAAWYETQRDFARAAAALDAYLLLAPNYGDSAAAREKLTRFRAFGSRKAPSLLRR